MHQAWLQRDLSVIFRFVECAVMVYTVPPLETWFTHLKCIIDCECSSIQWFLSVNWFALSLWAGFFMIVPEQECMTNDFHSHTMSTRWWTSRTGPITPWFFKWCIKGIMGNEWWGWKIFLFLHFCNRRLCFCAGEFDHKRKREENTFQELFHFFQFKPLLLVITQPNTLYRFLLFVLKMTHLSLAFRVLSYSHTKHVGSCPCETQHHNARLLSDHQGDAIW